jgi:hypothetical protein
MACLIIIYFHHRVCIFFCVCTHHDCCLCHAWIFIVAGKSLCILFIKDTNFPHPTTPPLLPLQFFLDQRAAPLPNMVPF